MSSRELIVGELRGYRWWKVDAEGWLTSPWRGKLRWQPGTNRAACLFRKRFRTWRPGKAPHPRGAPEAACECGFYGLHAIPQRRDHPVRFGWEIGIGSSGDRRQGLVFGVAAAHGRILVGTDGWRAACCRALAILWNADLPLDERARTTAGRYGLAVYRDPSALAAEWGPDDAQRDLAVA